MITKHTLAIVATAAGLTMAATPAHAETDAAEGAIDTSAIAAPAELGNDAEFTDLFARWENPDQPLSAQRSTVSIPSRMPIHDGRMTSDYGMRTHPVLKRRMGHKGIDLAAPTGTPIYATADGICVQG